MKEQINKIRDYFVSMAMYDGKWVVAVKYPPKWVAYSSDDQTIFVNQDDKNDNIWWYYAKDETIEIDDIINFVDETVQTNIEAIKKVELFKLKASELKRLFNDENMSFSRLQKLRFVFDDKVVAKPVKEKHQPKAAPTKEEIQEHDIFQPETATEATETAQVKEDNTQPKKRQQKQNKEENKGLRAVTPVEMSQSDIDNLRG